MVVIRRGSQTEVQSGVDRRQAAIVESLPDIAIGQDGERLISKEPVVLINLPKRDSGQAVERRDPRRDAGGARAAPAGEARRGPDVPAGHVRDHRGAIDRQRVPRRGRRRDAALRLTRLDGRRRVRRRPHRLRFRDLGRCRADAAGVPAPRLLGADLQARRHRSLRCGEGADRIRSAAHARGQARDAVLRRPVGSAVQVHQLPRHDDLGDLLDRRDHRRDDHDVRERRVAHGRDRHAARAGLLAVARSSPRSWSRRCCWA